MSQKVVDFSIFYSSFVMIQEGQKVMKIETLHDLFRLKFDQDIMRTSGEKSKFFHESFLMRNIVFS